MDKIIVIIRKILFIIATVYCVYISVNNYELSEICLDSSLRILDSSGKVYLEPLTGNTGYMSINGVYTFYENVLKDGYTIHTEKITDDSIDTIFTKSNNPTLRLYYKYPECYIALFSSEYETSGKPFSYIIEE